MDPQTVNKNQTDRTLAGKYLTFSLNGEEYGIGIIRIKEIIGMMPVTSIPKMPNHFKGVINLRGRVIPVVDLRLRFAMDEGDYTEKTCIIIVEMTTGDTQAQVGLVVDGVSEVLNVRSDDIEPSPQLGGAGQVDFLLGLAKTDGRVKMLLDIDQVLEADDLGVMAEHHQQAA